MQVRGTIFSKWPRDFRLLAVAVFGTGIFFGVLMTLFNNFIVDRFNMEPHRLGYLESLREVPGLLSVLMVALILRHPLPLVSGVAVVIMGLGIMAFPLATTVMALTLFSLFWSIGFHCWVPLEQVMALRFSPPGDKGRWLGRLRSVHSAAWLLAIGYWWLHSDDARDRVFRAISRRWYCHGHWWPAIDVCDP